MSTKTTTITTRACTCGCGQPTSKAKSLYVPGHDARHASHIAREVLAGGNLALLKALPSAALRVKAERMIQRVSAVKAAPVIETAGEIKVGRWTYPARLVDGVMERNTKRDGSGEWVAA